MRGVESCEHNGERCRSCRLCLVWGLPFLMWVSSISASHLQAPNSRSLDPTLGEGGPYLTCSLSSREVRAGTPGRNLAVGAVADAAGSLAHWLMPSSLSYSVQNYPPRDGAAISGLCLPASISDQTLLPTHVPSPSTHVPRFFPSRRFLNLGFPLTCLGRVKLTKPTRTDPNTMGIPGASSNKYMVPPSS